MSGTYLLASPEREMDVLANSHESKHFCSRTGCAKPMKNLPQKLIDWLKEGDISYLALATECLRGKYGKLQRMYKVDTARRRLDEMMEIGKPTYNPNVHPLKENGIVCGWTWGGKKQEFREVKVMSWDNKTVDRVIRIPK